MSEVNSTSNSVHYKSLDFMGYPEYKVGDDGSIWVCKICKLTGYGSVCVPCPWRTHKIIIHPIYGTAITALSSKNIKSKNFYVSRLVLSAFVGPCPEGMEACHFPDRDPTNNRLENLRWDTHKSNLADRIIHGTMPDTKGEKASCAKLINIEVLAIRRLHKDKIYNQRQLAKMFGIHHSQVNKIIKRVKWKHI